MEGSRNSGRYFSIGTSEESDRDHASEKAIAVYRDRSGNKSLFCVSSLFLVFLIIAGLTLIFLLKSNMLPLSNEGAVSTPAVPFSSITHPMSPSSYWGNVRKPFPTGAFWTNLVVADGNGAIGLHPYGIKADKDAGVQISYGATRRSISRNVVADTFAVDLQLSAVEPISRKFIESYDNFSVTVGFELHGATMRAPLVKGSAYVTVEYANAVPTISSSLMKISSLEKKNVSDRPDVIGSGVHYEVTLGNFQKWYVYCSVPTVEFIQEGDKLTASGAIQGYIRVGILPALNPLVDAFSLLALYAQSYPTSAKMDLLYSVADSADLHVEYHVTGAGEILMFALHHQWPLLQRPNLNSDENRLAREVYGHVWGMKGRLTPVVGNTWIIRYKWVDVGWNYAVQTSLTTPQLNSIAKELQKDVNTILPTAADPYSFGKELNRMARLAVLADDMGIAAARGSAVEAMKTAMKSWLDQTNTDTFLYDNTYGGIVTRMGSTDKGADYGSGWYNDHHFHYGYFLHAAAVLARFDRAYFDTYAKVFESLRKDICNMDTDSDPNYPFARHKDFFDGHSWASGLFQQANGKSQESSSEAVHAYYGCYLYGIAVGNENLQKFARSLLTMEVNAAKSYWHMAPDESYGNASVFTLKSGLINSRISGNAGTDWVGVYDDVFACSRMVGNVGALDATTSTWFGDALEYVHGINIMPLSPVTATLFDASYVSGQYPVLASVLPTNVPTEFEFCAANPHCVAVNLTDGKCCPNSDGVILACCEQEPGGLKRMQPEWESFIYAFLALVDREAAWDKAIKMTNFGTGNSKSNMLYWIASRPAKLDEFDATNKADDFYFTAGGPQSCADNSACDAVGMSGLCCPTTDDGAGIYLGCCPKTAAA